jgi:hypothetical protein
MTSSSSSKNNRKVQPAFDGAPFDKDGNCLKHNTVQLAEPVKQDGKLMYKEVKMVSSHSKLHRIS